MSKTPTSKSPQWREFEQIVTRIEQALVPFGVTVKSPDRIRSLITKRKREVDASVRLRVGTAEILGTIECRKRSAKQDVTWLEQLAAKRQAIGASWTIAVSSSAFSSDAVTAAAHYGIKLRVLSEFDPDELATWVLPQSLGHLYHGCTPVGPITVSLDSPPCGELKPFQEDMAHDSRVFYRRDEEKHLTLSDVWIATQNAQPEIYGDVPPSGEKVRKRLKLIIPDDLHMYTPDGLCRVREIEFEADLYWVQEIIPLEHASVVKYTEPGSSGMVPIARAEFTTKGATTNIRLGFQVQQGSDSANLSVELIPPKASDTSEKN